MAVTTRHLELHNFTPQKTISVVPLARKVSKEHYPAEGCLWVVIVLNIESQHRRTILKAFNQQLSSSWHT